MLLLPEFHEGQSKVSQTDQLNCVLTKNRYSSYFFISLKALSKGYVWWYGYVWYFKINPHFRWTRNLDGWYWTKNKSRGGSGYGRRFMFRRSWVWILVPYIGWNWHFFTLICCKNCIVCLKRPKINVKEAGVGPFKKIKACNSGNMPFSWGLNFTFLIIIIIVIISNSNTR